MAHESTTRGSVGLSDMRPIQKGALAVGAVFLLVGILGFLPGVTTDYDDMTFAGHESDAELLGIFQVNVLHNLVHLAFGVIGLAAARTSSWARNFLLVGGGVYLVLWVYGLVVDLDSRANFAAFNHPDNWLHFSLGAGMLALGVLLQRAGSSEVSLRT